MGFNINKEFPTRFVSGDEIAGNEVTVTIREVKKEKAYSSKTRKDEIVLVIYFQGSDRGVCLKKERSKEIVAALKSADTDDWIGKNLTMFTKKKEAFGAERNIIHFKA